MARQSHRGETERGQKRPRQKAKGGIRGQGWWRLRWPEAAAVVDVMAEGEGGHDMDLWKRLVRDRRSPNFSLSIWRPLTVRWKREIFTMYLVGNKF